jgi:hypothetical protein
MGQWLTDAPPGYGALEESFGRGIDEPFSPERDIPGIPVRYTGPESNGFPARLRNVCLT